MQYKSHIKIVPRGSSPRDTDKMKSIEIKTNSTKRSDIISEFYRSTKKVGRIDQYSLRNHWEIFDVEIEFNDPPWSSHNELCGKLISYDCAEGWKATEQYIYIRVQQGHESDYISKLNNYHSGLNPTNSSDCIVRVTVDPRIQ